MADDIRTTRGPDRRPASRGRPDRGSQTLLVVPAAAFLQGTPAQQQALSALTRTAMPALQAYADRGQDIVVQACDDRLSAQARRDALAQAHDLPVQLADLGQARQFGRMAGTTALGAAAMAVVLGVSVQGGAIHWVGATALMGVIVAMGGALSVLAAMRPAPAHTLLRAAELARAPEDPAWQALFDLRAASVHADLPSAAQADLWSALAAIEQRLLTQGASASVQDALMDATGRLTAASDAAQTTTEGGEDTLQAIRRITSAARTAHQEVHAPPPRRVPGSE